MRQRVAQRITQRVQAGTVTAASYSRQKVEMAFQKVKVDLTPDLLRSWDDAKADEAQIRAELVAALPSIAERKAQREERIQARLVAKDVERQRVRQLQADARQLQAEEMQVAVAALAEKEAFKQAVENEIEELPEKVTIDRGTPEPVKESERDIAIAARKEQRRLTNMRVDELKAIAKGRGLAGYSKMRKEELLILLTTNS